MNILVIDTDAYAGNFERELTAYVTGCIGDCGKGDKQAEMFVKDLGQDVLDRFEEVVMHVPDEYGCNRPTRIYPTPGFFNDGLGNNYPDSEWGKPGVVEKYNKSAKEAGLTNGTPGRCPAYLSVAIYFNEIPDDLLEIVVERTKKFCARPTTILAPKKIKLLGIRIVEEVIVSKELRRVL